MQITPAPNMQRPAREISDVAELLDRIEYRERLLLKATREPGKNLLAETEITTGFNRTDINQIRELMVT